jgi:hypothetical protein
MPSRSTLATLTIAPILAFALGAAACFFLVTARFTSELDKLTDGLLIDRTVALQNLRDGNTRFVEQQIESLAWNQLITVGHRKERGELPSAAVQEAVQYNCRRFSTQKESLAPKVAEERAYWCGLLTK